MGKLAARGAALAPAAAARRPGSTSTSAYCQARLRLPLDLLQGVGQHLCRLLTEAVPAQALWLGRQVRLIDGSTASLPATPANQARWPQASSQAPGCGFPTIRLVGLFCLHSGALLQRLGSALGTGLARRLWSTLQAFDVLVGDRGFGSFFDCALLQARQVDVVVRLCAGRRHDFRQGRPLGPNQRLVTWARPARHHVPCSDAEYAALPEQLTVRYVRYQLHWPGFRPSTIIIVTTLLDLLAYPAADLVAPYRRRWEIELHWRECKTTLGLEALRCQSPAMIERERKLLLHAIAYDLVRALMQEAAQAHGAPLERLSFQGTLTTLGQFAGALPAGRVDPAARARVLRQALAAVAADRLPHRPGRAEPRCLKRVVCEVFCKRVGRGRRQENHNKPIP